MRARSYTHCVCLHVRALLYDTKHQEQQQQKEEEKKNSFVFIIESFALIYFYVSTPIRLFRFYVRLCHCRCCCCCCCLGLFLLSFLLYFFEYGRERSVAIRDICIHTHSIPIRIICILFVCYSDVLLL